MDPALVFVVGSNIIMIMTCMERVITIDHVINTLNPEMRVDNLMQKVFSTNVWVKN